MAGVATMTKRAKPGKRDMRGPIQRLYDRQQVANDQSVLSVITPEQRAKGTYAGTRSIVNSHDPVERWKAAKKLTQSQQVAIETMQRLWRLAGLAQRVTANYGMVTGGGCAELRAATEIDAREDLHRIRGYFAGLDPWWNIFENCVRWGMPAGVVGGENDRNAANKVYTVVCFIADMIATKERL